MNAMRKWLGAIIVLLGLILPGTAQADGPARFVVRASRETIGDVCELYGLQLVRELGRSDLFLVTAPEGIPTDLLELSLANDGRVGGVERDGRARLPRSRHDDATGSSPILAGADIVPQSGGPLWTVLADQPAARLIGVDRAHAEQQLGRGVVVALVDTAVDASHPLLNGAILPGIDFTPPADAPYGQASAGALKQSTVTILSWHPGRAGLSSLQPPATSAGEWAAHGTMVASLVRAVAPDARILPLIAFEPDGSASVSSLVRAIYRAAEEGAKVLNMSFELDRPSAEVRRAIRYATAQGVVCVGSAGNEGSDALVLPAELPEVIGVASTTLDDTLAPFSNYGYRVDLAAPGVDLLTAFPGNRYASASGTSFSAALVSGGVAVLAGKEPGLDHDDAARAVANSVFVSPELGGGRLDLPAALRSLGGGRRSEDAWTR